MPTRYLVRLDEIDPRDAADYCYVTNAGSNCQVALCDENGLNELRKRYGDKVSYIPIW